MTIDINPDLYAQVPDEHGRFGVYGGKFVAETLMSALAELEALYDSLKDDPVFIEEFDTDLAHYVGRPSPLYEAARWSDMIGGARIYLKREDLNHTGAHKVNNTIGQALLAKYGEEACHCRNRRRSAWCGECNGSGTTRPRVPCLHGRGRYPSASAKRISNEASWRDSCARNIWL